MREEKIAIFDLDGSLVKTDEANSAAYGHALGMFGVHGMYALYGRVTAEMVRGIGLGETDVNVVVRAKIDVYCKELWRTRLGPAADALRCVLLNRGAFEKVVLLSQSAERRAVETLRYYGLERYFDEIVCNGGSGDKYANPTFQEKTGNSGNA